MITKNKIIKREVPYYQKNFALNRRFGTKVFPTFVKYFHNDNFTKCTLTLVVELYILGERHEHRVTTEGYAKCNKEDTYDKTIGSKLAYSRALLAAVREIERHFNTEQIQIVKSTVNLRKKLTNIVIHEKEFIKKLSSK